MELTTRPKLKLRTEAAGARSRAATKQLPLSAPRRMKLPGWAVYHVMIVHQPCVVSCRET
jgi:hypothetical protein